MSNEAGIKDYKNTVLKCVHPLYLYHVETPGKGKVDINGVYVRTMTFYRQKEKRIRIVKLIIMIHNQLNSESPFQAYNSENNLKVYYKVSDVI